MKHLSVIITSKVALILLLLAPFQAYGQVAATPELGSISRVITLNSTTQSSPIINLTGSGVNTHKITWNTVGTVSAGACALQSSTVQTPWAGTSVIAAQTVTSSGGPVSSAATVAANYVQIVCTTPIVGTGTVYVSYIGTTGALTITGSITVIGGNPAAGLTSDPVPGYASYTGVSVGGNLVGVTGHGTAMDIYCTGGCAAGTEDTDDGTIAGGQTTGLQIGIGYMWSGSAWIRVGGSAADGLLVNLGTNNDVTVTGVVGGSGTAGTPDTRVLTVQGIPSMTPLLVTLSGSNTIDLVTTLDTITNPVTVTGAVTATITSFGSSLEVTQADPTMLNATVVGNKTNNAAAISTDNIGALTVLANAAQPSWTEGRLAALSANLKGDLRTMICDAALNDRCANVDANNYLQVVSPPITYNSTQPTKTNGQTDQLQITSRAALIVAPGVEGFNVTNAGTFATQSAITAASGSIASGAFAAGSLNSAIPDPCLYTAKSTQTINISTAATTVIIDQSGSNKTYICGISLLAAGADNVALVEDATNNCASPDNGLYGGTTAGTGWNLVANEGTNLGFTNSTVTKTSATNMDVCLITSAGVQLSGTVSYVQVP